MDKNEILQKSRLENKDEGMLIARNKGAVLGKRIMAAMCIVVLLIYVFVKRVDDFSYFAVLAIFNSFLIGENIEQYRFTKKKSDLWSTIFYCVITLLWLGLFVSWLMMGK